MPVSEFYAAGLVSADVNSHYGALFGVQQEYAPYGIGAGLCVGLAKVAYQNEGLTLQPSRLEQCGSSTPPRTSQS
jgi:hypothetical protein